MNVSLSGQASLGSQFWQTIVSVCLLLPFELVVHPSRTTRRTIVPSLPFQSVQRNPSKFHPSSFLCEIETILFTLPTRPNKQYAFTLVVPPLRTTSQTINRPILNDIVKLNHSYPSFNRWTIPFLTILKSQGNQSTRPAREYRTRREV